MATEPEKQEQWTSSVLLFCALLQLLLVHIAYRVDRGKTVPYVSTASWAIAFGVALGGLLSLMSPQRASNEGLDPHVLFFALLPPIILEAGFNTQRKGFFSNFMAILLLAVVGTLIATLATGGLLFWISRIVSGMTQLSLPEAFLYGAIISAIDPVSTLVVLRKSHAPPLLYNLLFGESVLNDAVAIVLSGLFQHATLHAASMTLGPAALQISLQLVGISIGSVMVAAIICYASAFVLRHSDEALKQHPTYEISTLLLSAYGCYVAAQSLKLSGLLAVFFSGVFIRHYHMYSISHTSAAAFTQMLSTAAFLAENFIYLYLGASLLAYSGTFCWNWIFIALSVGAILVARAVNTFPLCAFANLFRAERIPWRYMLVIWFSGLRGSIAFALALNVRSNQEHDHAAVMRASALVTVISTTVFFGAATAPLLRLLGLSRCPFHPSAPSGESTPLLALDIVTEQGVALPSDTPDDDGRPPRRWSARDVWVRFDEAHLKPLFGGNPRDQFV